MKRNLTKLFFSFVFIQLVSLTVQAQEITIESPKVGRFDGGAYKARVDFIADKDNLIITENNGEIIDKPVAIAGGKYMYTCICDVNDTNSFGFNISVSGGTDMQLLKVYIEENQHYTYEVSVADIPYTIGEVKVVNANQVVPVDQKAAVTVSSNYKDLIIRSETGEQVEGPTFNSSGLFEFVIYYDLSNESSRNVSRKLTFSVNNMAAITHEVGILSPKQGVEIAVVVVQESSCYSYNLNMAKNCFINGLYQQAYTSYTTAFQCDDAPADKGVEEKNSRTMRTLDVALKRAQGSYEKAEDFRRREIMDSCMFYYQDAYKYRVAILKVNPSDPYCLEFHSKYDYMKANLPRVVSGKVMNNIRMDVNGKNLPIPGAYIVARVYRTKQERVNGVPVEKLGEEIKSKAVTLGKTDENGNFKVYVPKNPQGEKYVLYFTEDEYFSGSSKPIEHIPTDADLQENLQVKITPKGINKYN